MTYYKGSNPQGHYYPTKAAAEKEAKRYRKVWDGIVVVRHRIPGSKRSYYTVEKR